MNQRLAFPQQTLFFIPLALAACAPYPEGLRSTPDGTGPMVVVDWDAEPLPELPFPNDLATRPDQTSPTGLRLNISQVGVTKHESDMREKVNSMSGFGIFSPMTVGFDAPLDLDNIAARHRDDSNLGDAQFTDDAFFVICVDPDSVDYLKAVSLEVGQGRYPVDIPNPARYFPNDARDESPSILFDTENEDLNGNGQLDWGEDSDNDGVLDQANLYPKDGDPREDLLAWYERETDTLIFRPVLPLREETAYAVVLTDRLIGENGETIRSPWEYVHHLRQTHALEPLYDALPQFGLEMENVSFAWTFTTGRVTGDLVDVRRGLYGEGPFSKLAAEYPAAITQADIIHEIEGIDPYRLPAASLAATIANLGLLGDQGSIIEESYTEYAGDIVAGNFTTPYFLYDRDDGGSDDSDEWWRMNSVLGTYEAGEQNVPFTCIMPSPDLGVEQPYDVVLFGHGYGSSRFDFVGFAWAFTRMGYATCAMDFPGHGPTIDSEDQEIFEPVLDANGLYPFLEHLLNSRYRDLDNDGENDSGGDQWVADVFHTRDMVRQAVVDWIQMVRSFKNCGNGNMALQEGGQLMSCDWNDDGIPDLGTEDAEYFILGGSLGGINSAVAAAVMPEVTAFAPISAGGGLLDMALRTEIGGAVEAMHGRLQSPLFVGYPSEDSSSLQVVQIVNSVMKMRELPVATINEIPVDGKIVIENLDNGEIREGWMPPDGRFRISIPADAMDATEKRRATGMPDSGPELGETYAVQDNEGLGDRFEIRIYDANDTLIATLDSFEEDVLHEGVTMEAGSPLIAGSHGSGRIRATPDLRRAAYVFGAAMEAGDPLSYSRYYLKEPYQELGGEPTNILLMPTVGDTIVSFSAGLTLARGSGIIPQEVVDERYGMTVDQWLVERRVIQGIAAVGPYTDVNGSPCLFDADDLDNGQDGTGAPSDAPLRLTVQTASGESALRMPYISTTGSHGFTFPDPNLDYDINSFSINQIAGYFYSGGQEVSDDECLEDFSCPWIPVLESIENWDEE